LARTAKAVSTYRSCYFAVGVGYGFNGPTVSSLLSELDGIDPIDRTSMNRIRDDAFRAAVEATGAQSGCIIGGPPTR